MILAESLNSKTPMLYEYTVLFAFTFPLSRRWERGNKRQGKGGGEEGIY